MTVVSYSIRKFTCIGLAKREKGGVGGKEVIEKVKLNNLNNARNSGHAPSESLPWGKLGPWWESAVFMLNSQCGHQTMLNMILEFKSNYFSFSVSPKCQ